MSTRQKLKTAISAIDDMRTSFERANRESQDSCTRKIRTALSEIDDAESYLKKAMLDLPEE